MIQSGRNSRRVRPNPLRVWSGRRLHVTGMTRIASVLAIAALLSVGCSTAQAPGFIERHPSEGWRVALHPQEFSSVHVNADIVADYKSYIASLPPPRSQAESRMRLLEDGTGRLAIEFSIPVAGFWSAIWWDHVLVYDTNNKRIETLKYRRGRADWWI